MLRLLNLLTRRRSPRRELFMHEDDWGQIEVLPASCADWCAQELARIGAFAAQHEAPDGSGWTDMYVRKPGPATLESLAIPFGEAVDAIGRHLPAFDMVVSGTFSAQCPHRSRCCWPIGLAAAPSLSPTPTRRRATAESFWRRAGRAACSLASCDDAGGARGASARFGNLPRMRS